MMDFLEDASGWLGDFLLNVFSSPSWEAPLMEFIDQHCVAFDGQEENSLEHSSSHERFCELVDSLLEVHLAEIGLTAEDFMAVLSKAPVNSEFRNVVMEQIMAVDDFLTFKKLMVKRNAELNVQALEARFSHKQPLGVAEDSELEEALRRSTLGTRLGPADTTSPSEEDAISAAMVASRAEYEELARAREKLEIAQLESALAASLAMEEEKIRQAQARLEVQASAAAVVGSVASVTAMPTKIDMSSLPTMINSTNHTYSSSSSLATSGSVLPRQMAPGATSTSPNFSGSLPALPGMGSRSNLRGSGMDSSELDALLSGGRGGGTNTQADVDDARRRADQLFARNADRLAALDAGASGAIDAAEVAQRKRHLQGLRDQLRAQKAAERAEALQETQPGPSMRPIVAAGVAAVAASTSPAKDDETARRAMLAAKIRADIMSGM